MIEFKEFAKEMVLDLRKYLIVIASIAFVWAGVGIVRNGVPLVYAIVFGFIIVSFLAILYVLQSIVTYFIFKLVNFIFK